MEQGTIRSDRWNEAAKYGLIFGAISAAYLYLGHIQVALGVSGAFASILGFVLWAGKLTGCIMLMKHVMGKFYLKHPESVTSDIFRLGVLIALLSALVYSVVTVADMLYVFPEYYDAVYTAVIEEYAKVLPAQQVDELRTVLVYAPKFTFIGNFIYCFLFGTILSLILSRNTHSKDPFRNYKQDEQ